MKHEKQLEDNEIPPPLPSVAISQTIPTAGAGGEAFTLGRPIRRENMNGLSHFLTP